MRLVYDKTGIEVKTGDVVHLHNAPHFVVAFNKPHKPASSGKVFVRQMSEEGYGMEYFVSVIGAKWIEREDYE